MPYDPTWPQFGDDLTSLRLRGQWNGLDDKITAIPAGPPGPKGDTGDKGDTGEVSSATLADAIAGTARNPAATAPFPGTFSDPPTQAEMLAFAAYVETLRAALLR